MASGTKPNPENKLFVGGCPTGTSEEELRQVFEKHGTVEEVFVMRGGSRSGMACAFVRFETQEMAQAAIEEIHGQVTMARTAEPLVVRWADAPGSRKRDTRERRAPSNGVNSRDNGGQQQGYPPYMGMQLHPQMAAQMQAAQMQMHQQMGGYGGGYYPTPASQQQIAAMQNWQHQQMLQMGLMGYPPQQMPHPNWPPSHTQL